MFSGCPSVSASVRPCVRACVLLANRWTQFHQTLVIGYLVIKIILLSLFRLLTSAT